MYKYELVKESKSLFSIPKYCFTAPVMGEYVNQHIANVQLGILDRDQEKSYRYKEKENNIHHLLVSRIWLMEPRVGCLLPELYAGTFWIGLR